MDKVYVYKRTRAPEVYNIVEIHKTACTYIGSNTRLHFTFYRSMVHTVFITVKCFTTYSIGARVKNDFRCTRTNTYKSMCERKTIVARNYSGIKMQVK